MRRYVQCDLHRCRLVVCTEVGHLHRSNVLESEWRPVSRIAESHINPKPLTTISDQRCPH
jgi:hypothetical protein